MPRYRSSLPQLSNSLFLTDGGLETTIIFHYGIEIPHFAAIDLLRHKQGYEALRKYYRSYVSIARKYDVGIILESATWRASPDWGVRLGFSPESLAHFNRQAIELLSNIRSEYEKTRAKMVISGCIGPRGDGYKTSDRMKVEEAESYHANQIGIFAETDADLVTALTLTYEEEAIGVTRAAKSVGMPVVVSFTVETDGNLPSGQSLKDAIKNVDASTADPPAYYMINCAHPTHFESLLSFGGPWVRRIRGIRANASDKSHAELDEAKELDDGNPQEFGQQYRRLRELSESIHIFGGCCGTDHRHIEEICKVFLPQI